MLKAPLKYLGSILSLIDHELNLTKIILYFILKSNKNLHFVISEKEINIVEIITSLCHQLNTEKHQYNFKLGQRVILLEKAKSVFVIEKLAPIINLRSYDVCNTKEDPKNLNKYIPLSNYDIQRIGNIQNRITDYKEYFGAAEQSDFVNNEKILIIANQQIFKNIPKEYPSCFVSENENGNVEIEYNSPLLPKITILKNIKLLDNYLDKEINGSQIKFNTCIFIGSSKFENSINIVRKYYNQQEFVRVIFIGDKDIKLDLGNNQIPLRWKWTIPELNFFKGVRNIQHEIIVVKNDNFEKSITNFYQEIREIEIRHTIGLKSIYRFIRRLYYDWNLKQETTFIKLQQIQHEFDIAMKQLLIETLGNIFADFDFDKYHNPLSAKFAEIIMALRTNNKSEKLKSYQRQIHQLILPSFLCKTNKAELNEIAKQSEHRVGVKSLKDISHLQSAVSKHLSDSNRNFYSLTANGTKTEILPYSKSDDSKDEHHKVISSIYGSGKVEKLIERLGRAKSEYMLLLYSIEEKAFQYYKDMYHSELNKEYASFDRYEISGIEFNDPYYQYSTFDEWLEDFLSIRTDEKEIDYYRISFTDGSKIKLPSSKSILKLLDNEKIVISVEDLSIRDKVMIYSNPDKKLLRDIIELMNPELIKKADEYSLLWKACLNDAYQNNNMTEPLYKQLVKNHLSVSEFTFRKYLDGEVMFPRSFSDLLIIAKTINNPSLSFDFLKNTMKPKIEEYRGKEIEYGFKFSNSINNFIISGETDEFISEWLTTTEIENIVSQIPVKTIKDIELITQNNDD